MENLESLLAHWRLQEPQRVSLGSLRTDPAFQPRDVTLAPFRDRGRLEAESARHVEQLTRALSGAGELEPLLAARIGGKLIVVDGHHRLAAHRRSGRSHVLARVLETTTESALFVSKLANCGGAKLLMHAEQQRECAWQYLARVTMRGRLPLAPGQSTRTLAALFGTSHDTISKMVQKLPKVDLGDYQTEAHDPGTAWPRWKYVKGNAWRDAFAEVSADARERHRDERRAGKLAALIDRDGMDAVLRSLRLLNQEALIEAAEKLAESSGDPTADY
jgi:ParB-like chromosome segregation protein Spo0J